ncbi:hypothetical protein AAG570_005762 [Ranatra chinensis]|uniref:Transposase n=1 Tax=Ranatra chinensis TaxID=642074 RepID=A0ABD0XYD3_9HEMI
MMIRAGHRNKDIMTATQCSLNTVKTIRHELEYCTGDYEDVARRKIPSRRSDCVGTAEFLANLQEQVLKNPGIRIRPLSRKMNVAASTMKLALNEDLRYYSYKRRNSQLLTAKTREKRLINAKKLLSKVKHPAEPQTIWFFSDEKTFCQDQKHKTQNNRWFAYSTKDSPRVIQTQFPQTVMVFGCVSSEGDVMPPHFFQESLRLTSDGYVEFLNTVVKPWISRVATVALNFDALLQPGHGPGPPQKATTPLPPLQGRKQVQQTNKCMLRESIHWCVRMVRGGHIQIRISSKFGVKGFEFFGKDLLDCGDIEVGVKSVIRVVPGVPIEAANVVDMGPIGVLEFSRSWRDVGCCRNWLQLQHAAHT